MSKAKKTCSSCKHWDLDSGQARNGDMGECMAAEHIGETRTGPRMSQIGCDDCGDGVQTTPDFGCILHEAK